MKTKNTTYIEEELKKIKNIVLTSREKEEIFLRVTQYADSHTPKKSPYWDWSIFVSNFSYETRRTLVYVTAGIIILVLAGGGTVYAAEQSLPGDILYPLKLHVTEPFQSALALSASAKAYVEADHAERRLEEAEILAVEGRFDITLAEKVKTNFEKQVLSFVVLQKKIADNQTQDSANEAESVQSSFNTKMNAHSRILEKIKDHVADEGKVYIEDLEKVVRTKISNSSGDIPQTYVKYGDTTSTENKNNRSSFKEKTERIKAIIENTAKEIKKSNTDASRIEKDIIEDSYFVLDRAEQQLEDAEQEYNSGDSDNAYSSLISSERSAEEAGISVRQGLELGKKKNER